MAEKELHFLRTADREQTRVLQKEGTFFREKQVETVQIDLQFIHFHLGEVGVVSQIEGETRGEAVLQVSPNLSQPLSMSHGDPVSHFTQNIRGQLQITLLRDLDAGERSSQRQAEQVVLAWQRSPEGGFVTSPDTALEV